MKRDVDYLIAQSAVDCPSPSPVLEEDGGL